MIRIAILWAVALLLAMAGTAACGDDDEGTGALSLNEYLILTLRLEAEQSRSAAVWYEELAQLSGEPDAHFEARMERQDWGELYAEWADALAGVTPPPEVQAYQETLLNLLPELEKYSDGLAATEDPEERSQLNLRLLELWSEFTEALVEVQGLVVTALEEQSDDPLNDYLSAATEVRLELAREAGAIGLQQQELLHSDGLDEDKDAMLAFHEAYLVALEDFEKHWRELVPPPKAEELHQRQAELTADMLAVEQRLVGNLPDADESIPIAELGSFEETIARLRTLDADWNELLIEVLSR